MRLLGLLLALPGLCAAHALTPEECSEGSEFIRHAALARDNGVEAAQFLGRLQDDIAQIQAFPPALRWFVQDDEDAAFLMAAATAVFRAPEAADAHSARFFSTCVLRGGGPST